MESGDVPVIKCQHRDNNVAQMADRILQEIIQMCTKKIRKAAVPALPEQGPGNAGECLKI